MGKTGFIKKSIIIFIALSFIGFGQETGENSFSPYVSRIKAEVNETNIVLTWKNPEGVEGKILIYRHTEEITRENIQYARLLIVTEIGKESYIDSPGTITEYYYAILIQDRNRKIHEVFIPYRNKTVSGVKIKEIEPEEEIAAVITDLKAEISDNSIIITFRSSKPQRYLLLYRSTDPLINEDSLIQATTPVMIEDFSYKYTDYPIAGIEYYYAVLDAGLVKIGKIELIPGQNTLEKPVMIPLKESFEDTDAVTRRSLPLPYLDLISGIEFGDTIISSVASYLPEEKKITESTGNTIKKVLSGVQLKQEEIILKPFIFPIDLAENIGGEASILQKIISEYFAHGLYHKAEMQLRNYLRIKHAKDVEARSYFYLGQIFYFKGAYRDAFLAFLMAQSLYYAEIQPWLNACFSHFFRNE